MRGRLFWLCLCVAGWCNAAIYQWTDSAGIVHFSDEAPPKHVEVIVRDDIENLPAPAAQPPRQWQSMPRPTRDARRPRKPRTRSTAGDTREEERQRCDKYRRRIATTESKLRAGYSARRGIELTERLRADRDAYYHECR